MTVSLSWPATLPPPTMNGYGIEDKPRIARTDMDSGTARQRQTSRQAPSDVSARWVFSLFQYAIFEAWLEHRAKYGANWFNITYLGGIGRVPCEARFKDGKAPSKFQNGAVVVVTATLEVRERPKLSEADLSALIDETDDMLFRFIGDFGRLLTSSLWPSGDDLYIIPGEQPEVLFPAIVNLHALMFGPLWASGDDLYLIGGEHMPYLLDQCTAMHAFMSNSLSLWPS